MIFSEPPSPNDNAKDETADVIDSTFINSSYVNLRKIIEIIKTKKRNFF